MVVEGKTVVPMRIGLKAPVCPVRALVGVC